jgi:hypothetical protein
VRILLLLVAAAALSQTACGHVFSAIHARDERVDRISVAPLESDASLQCGEDPCAAVQLERSSREGHSETIFGTVALAEALGAVGLLIGGGVVAGGHSSSPLSTLDAGISSAPFFLASAALAAVFAVDLGLHGSNRASYGRQFDPPRLASPALATWDGVQVPLTAADVWSGAGDPPSRFSVSRAVYLKLAQAPPVGARPLPAGHRRLAVLELRSSSPELNPASVRYFGDVLRGAALRESAATEVLPRETLLADLASCGSECALEMGRRAGADVVVAGELQRLDGKYRLSFQLYETKGGRLLSAAFAGGATVDELDEDVRRAARALFQPLR